MISRGENDYCFARARYPYRRRPPSCPYLSVHLPPNESANWCFRSPTPLPLLGWFYPFPAFDPRTYRRQFQLIVAVQIVSGAILPAVPVGVHLAFARFGCNLLLKLLGSPFCRGVLEIKNRLQLIFKSLASLSNGSARVEGAVR